MDYCNRCGMAADDPRELYRFPGEVADVVATGLITECVCKGCCTRIESVLSENVQEPGILAFVLELTDAVDSLHLGFLDRQADRQAARERVLDDE